jgi:signal transduction histidine kinase
VRVLWFLWPAGIAAVLFAASLMVAVDLPWPELIAISAVGTILMVMGLAWWSRRPANRIGPLLTGLGFAWLVPSLHYSMESLPWTLALVLPTLHQAILAHLLLAYPSGVVARRLDRMTLAFAYGNATVGSLVVAMFTRDPGSLGYVGFPRNLVLVDPDVTIWRFVVTVQTIVALAVTVLVVGLIIRRLVAATNPARRRLAPLLVGGVAAASLALGNPFGGSFIGRFVPWVDAHWMEFHWATIAAYAVVPLAVSFGLIRSRMERSAVAGLVIDLDRSARSDDMRGALVRALRDPSLAFARFSVADQQFTDRYGNPMELPEPGSGRIATTLERDGAPVAALIYDESLGDDPELMSAASAAVRLVLDNERLQDELRQQLDEVRASRARIVEAGDAERRRLERNIHDGSQQKILTLSLSLQLARRRLASQADPRLTELVDQAGNLTAEILSEIRSLAHGLHPAILAEEGLGEALEWLAGSAAIPVRVEAVPDGRLPEHVEVAAYYVVSEALTNVAKHASATGASVSAARFHGRLVIDVVDDGVGGADVAGGAGLRGLEDRVAAVGGWLSITSPRGQGTRIHAEMPCE